MRINFKIFIRMFSALAYRVGATLVKTGRSYGA